MENGMDETEQSTDVLVIGAGLAGLTAAAERRRAGLRVLVLELSDPLLALLRRQIGQRHVVVALVVRTLQGEPGRLALGHHAQDEVEIEAR